METNKRVWLIYLTGLLLAIHFASVTYINSSLLKQFVGDGAISALYALGSALSVVLLLLTPLIMRRRGSVFTFMFFIGLEIFAVFGMGSSTAALAVILFFLIHTAGDSILYLCLDVNMEQETKLEGTTGGKRGRLLTAENIAWTLSPLALVFLTGSGFGKVYFLSGAVLIPLLFIILFFFKNTEKADEKEASILNSISFLRTQKDVARVIMVQFMLNFFYSWMIIYMPLLLNKDMGFGWDKIGYLFLIMLLPFLFFELPVGILADKKLGEKEIIATGFIVMSLATFFIPLIDGPVFWIWAAVLFVSRIGATFVEMGSESYFFKHVKEDNTGVISIFRMVRPLSYLAAPLLAFPVVFLGSYSTSFYYLAAFTLLGLFFIPKVDTK